MHKHHSVKVSRARQQKTGGYIVIIVLLLTAVLLMLGLSLATRTTEEVYQSGQEADTTRVFNAAETGIEAALYAIQEGDITESGGNINFTNTIDSPAGSNSQLTVSGTLTDKFNLNVTQGEVLTLKWKESTVIHWKHADNCSDAASLIITLYYPAGTGAEARHLTYNPFNGLAGCQRGTSFGIADDSNNYYPEGSTTPVNGSEITLTADKFFRSETIPTLTDAIVRVRPLYDDAAFTIENSSAIKVVSTAFDTSGGSSAETRKIQVIRTEPAPPSVFDYAVFSGGSLTK